MPKLPLELRDISPHPDAVRITGTRPDGLPDGVHTGGAWVYDGMVFKPLDARPYPNAEFLVETEEVDCLAAMENTPFFPKNWTTETINDRRFLVRHEALVLHKDFTPAMLDKEVPLGVEAAIRNLNRAGWTINDHISLAISKIGVYFILDLSAAHKQSNKMSTIDAEDWLVHTFWKECEYIHLATLRDHARHILITRKFILDYPEHRHVYASFNRPINSLWASIPNAVYVQQDNASWDTVVPHTWVVTPNPLPEETIYRYELTHGFSPWFEKETAPV